MPCKPRPRSTWTSLGVIVGIAALALMILACGGGNNGSLATGGSSAGNTTTQHFKIGDQVKVGDTFMVTVNSVKASTGNAYEQPSSGNTYMIVTVTLKNVSSSEQDVSSALNFGLKDGTGQAYDETIVSGATPPDGKIEPGGLLKGQLAYEVPKAQHAFTFSFEADITSSGQTLWELSL